MSKIEIELKKLSRNDIENAAPSVENNILVFDFETSGLPDEKADTDFIIEDDLQYWKNGKPKWKQIRIKDEDGNYVQKDGNYVWMLPKVKDKDGNIKKDKDGKPIDIMIQQGTASNPEYWPHSVQFCYLTYNKENGALKIFNERIKLPAGVKVTPESEKIHHISTEEANTKGVPIKEAMDSFIEDYNAANVIVAHNIRFDRNMILVELKRLTLEYKDNNLELYTKYNDFMKVFYDNTKEYCTMNHGANDNKQDGTKIWIKTDQYKTGTKQGKEYYTSPKLMDLYATLFGYRPDESKLHDAKADVIVCFRCFYMMRYGQDIYVTAAPESEIKKEINMIEPPANEKVSAAAEVENSGDPNPGDKRPIDKISGGNAPSVKLILTEPESQFNLRDIGNKIDEEVERGDDIILKFMNDNADVNEKIDGAMPRRSKRLSEQPKIDYAEGVSRPKKKRATRKKGKTNDSQPLRRSKRNQNKKTSKPPVNKPKKYSKKKKAAKKPKKTVSKNTKKKRKTKGRKQTK